MRRLLMTVTVLLALSWAWTAHAQLRSWDEFEVFTNSDFEVSDYVGWSVALDEDTVVAGAPGADAAYVYRYDDGLEEWTETIVTGSDSIDFDFFGYAVAIDGDILVVGAPFWEAGGFPFTVGKAYIFRFDSELEEWAEEATVEVSGPSGGEQLGRSVAVDDGRVVIGTFFEEEVYIYEYDDDEEEWVETQVLTEDESADTNFGYAVAIAGDLLVASSYEQAVYVFRWDSDEEEWVEEQRLTDPDDPFDGWGFTVDTDGSKIIVAQGGPEFGSNAYNSAIIYSYDDEKEEWVVEAELSDPDDTIATTDRWGSTVAIDGDTVVIGDNLDDGFAINAGNAAVFRFDEDSGEWQHEETVLGSTVLTFDYFGSAVAICGDLILVGSRYNDDTIINGGAAFLYTQDCDSNGIRDSEELGDDCNDNGIPDHCDIADVRVQEIVHDLLENEDNFGAAIAASRSVLMIGAPERNEEGRGAAGGVFVYSLEDDRWVFDQEIHADDPDPSDRFGVAVAMDGDVAVIGARGVNSPASDQGVAFVYRYDVSKGSWEQETVLEAGDAAASDWFGMSVDIDGNVIVVGAYRSDPDDSDGEAVSGAGAAYVYRFAAGTWSQEAKLVASDRARFDEFGRGVSVSGGTILVGAPRTDDGGSSSGSAYIFRYAGDDWEEDAILTASDASEGAQFGYVVNLNDDVALIGAPQEGVVAPVETGAAYVFRLDGNEWSEEEKLREPEPDRSAKFGNAVAIRGNLAVVGAPDSNDVGAAYIFHYDEDLDIWEVTHSFVGTEDGDDQGMGDGTRTGAAVVATGFLVAVGSPGTDSIDTDAGAAAARLNLDCNDNGNLDACDLADGTSDDENLNGIPDECEDTVVSSVQFLRGDADASGGVSGIPDGLFLFRWQFRGGDDPPCEDSADADDNGEVNGLVDGLTILRWQFGGGVELPAPGPDECGRDPDDLDDGIGCEQTSEECSP